MGDLLRPSIMALVYRSQHDIKTLDDSLTRHRHVLDAIKAGDINAADTAAREVLRRTAIDLGIVLAGLKPTSAVTLAVPTRLTVRIISYENYAS